MKIAIITNSLLISGGTERQALNLARELRRLGHDAVLYTFRLNRQVCYPELLSALPIVECPADVPAFWRRFFKLPLVGQLCFTMRENFRAKRMAALLPLDVEVLNPHEQMAARVVRYARKRGIMARATLTINDLYLARWSLYDDPAFGVRKKGVVRRWVAWLRDTLENVLFLRYIESIAVPNDRTRDMVLWYLGRRAQVIRSGIDASAFVYQKRREIHTPVRLLSHGIFFIHRRYEDTICALALLQEEGIPATLTIIGNFTHKNTARAYHSRLLKLVWSLDLDDSVVFKGAVSEDELLDSFSSHDIFVFASHLQTWGIVVFEAMATGLPVVLSRSTGAAEVLTDYENVLLSNPLSPESIRDRIREFVMDKELYERVRMSGREFVEHNLSWNRYTSHMLKVFAGKD